MKMIKIATHDGVFHADEVFALAVLKLFLEKDNKRVSIIRTRDLEVISFCDMAVDVGGEYDKKRLKFDHHQKDKPESRKNGIPYASFGLIWKDFGKKLVSNTEVWKLVESKLVMPIDALDNGVTIASPIYDDLFEFGIGQVISAISIAHKEDDVSVAFDKAVEIAMIIVRGEILKSEAKIEGEREVAKEILEQAEPEILTLDKYLSWEVAVSKCKNIKLVIYPNKTPGRWCVQTARDNLEVFGKDRMSFPQSWRGLSDEELVETSGIVDAVFCHAGGFFAVAKTQEAAFELATKAINQVCIRN